MRLDVIEETAIADIAHIIRLSVLAALLFIAAMPAFIAALLFFLREVLPATAGLRFGHR
jgi:hypothetical protein